MTKAKLALVLAAAMCVFAATVTAASAAKFTSSVTPEQVVGSGGEQIFSVGTANVKCLTVTGESAKIAFPTEQIVSSAKYETCKVEGLGTAVVKCEPFNFHSSGTVTSSKDTGGTVTNGACEIVVAGICTIKVPAQLASGVTYTNEGGSVGIAANVSNLTYAASAGCIGFSKAGTNAGYKGELKVKGSVAKTTIAIV